MGFRLQRITLSLAFAAITCADIYGATVEQPPGVPVPPIGVMRKVLLQDGTPYEVAVGAVPTTILMPAPVEAFEGNNITTAANTAAAVFLQHTPGTKFFSVKALIPGTADLNVILGDSVYSFRFYYSENPTRSLVIQSPEKVRADRKMTHGSKRRTISISARRLYDLLQDAKTFFVVQESHPELQRSIEVAAPGKVIEHDGYRVIVDHVFRFDRDDTLVFRAIFLNDTDQPLAYDPSEVGLRVGQNLYWPSFAQLPRSIPARAPACLEWNVSPDVVDVQIISPDGKTANVTDRTSASLPVLGTYTFIAKDAKGRTDTLKFVVQYPVPTGEPNPVVATKDANAFGVRRLSLHQPEPGQNFGYVLYTGTADGRRAELSIKNDFSLIVPAKPAS